MRIYIVLPFPEHTWADIMVFTTYSAAEQAILRTARALDDNDQEYHWCSMVAYDGQDELYPVFLYTISTLDRLHREPYPTPSP